MADGNEDDEPTASDDGTININALLTHAFGTVTGQMSSSLDDLTKTMGKSEAASAAEQKAIQDQADAQSQINAVDAAAQAKTLADNNTAAAIFGTNPNASSYVLANYAAKIKGENEDLDARFQDIQGKLGQSFFDDPLGYIGNQFSLPIDAAAYNNALTHKQNDDAALSELSTHTMEAAQVNSVIDAADSNKKLAAVDKLTFAKSAQAVAESQQKLAQLGINTISVRDAINKQQFDAVVSMNGVLNDQMRMQLAKNADTRAEITAKLQSDYRDQLLSDKKQTDETNALWQTKLDKTTALLGAPKITLGQYKTMSGPLKNAYESIMTSADLEDGRLGFNTADILSKVNNINAPLNPGMNLVRDKLTNLWNAAANSYATKNPGQEFGKLPAGAQNNFVQNFFNDDFKKEYANIKDTGSIFSPAPLTSVLSIPAVAATSLAKDLAPIANGNKQYPTRAQDIFTVASNKVAKGEISPEQAAAEVSTIYNAINADNASTMQYRRFAIEAPTKFNTTVYTGLGWASSQAVDMTNAAQLQTIFTRQNIISRQQVQMQQRSEAIKQQQKAGTYDGGQGDSSLIPFSGTSTFGGQQ